ncbi:DUF4331 domain-containing protein [Hydrocarboniphaga sp.]|uniref:DUF4331 domain-containing protein n=1 Tax=Hydrocarboniphaga sp. TaxID=2033016 RepID=UPI003D09C8BD
MKTGTFIPMALVIAATSLAAQASSHREAPFIAQNPTADGTDFYMFRSYEPGRAGYVTLLANYDPLQDSYGGPNYFALNPDVLYEILVDNNADAVEDLTFQFRFTNTVAGLAVPVGDVGGSPASLAIPLINLPPSGNAKPTLNRSESYTVSLVRGPRRSGSKQPVTKLSGGTTFVKPVDNIGLKSIPNYDKYASQYIYDMAIPGCSGQGRVFVGQRAEGFAVNLGEVFDLVNLNPLGARDAKGSATANKNITTLALEVPINCLTASTDAPIIGAWTTSSMRSTRTLNAAGEGPFKPASDQGEWVQVSRLGSPLVNEVVIGLPDKDRFNASEPRNDGQFASYVTNPTLPVLLNALFGDAAKVPATPRNDIVAAFLTGVANVNQPAGVVPSEMLRLNTAIAPTPAASQVNVGAALCFTNDGALLLSNPGCDPAGFPNGRRPGDDVVDIELSVVEGFLLGANNPNRDASGQYQVYTDGTLQDASQFNAVFPYLRAPLPGSPNGANGIATP